MSITDARSLLSQAQADMQAGQTTRLSTLVPGLERALANPDTPKTIDGSPVFLVDGFSDSLLVQMWLKLPEAKEAASKSPRLVNDPYPSIAYVLGFYYNEVRQPDQALRALEAGQAALRKHMEPTVAETAPLLWIETGAAHNIAGRWQPAYDAYKSALDLPGKDLEAQMHRGMGFSLIELNRLDEAEAAFNQSLKIEPNNASAKGELAYIAQLRRGGAKQAPTTFVPAYSAPAQ